MTAVRLGEHLKEIQAVSREIKKAKKGTPHYKDLCRRYRKLNRERAEALRWIKESEKNG